MTVAIITRAEAKARGLKRWYSGEPCKHGHVAERSTSTGVCIECRLGYVKAWREVNPEAKRARGKVWRAANPDKVRAYKKAYYAANRDVLRAQTKAWYAANRDRARARSKAFRTANADKVRAKKKAYHEENRDKKNARTREWLKQNPDAAREHKAAKRARKRSQMGVVSRGIRAKLRMLQNGKCAYCRASLKKAGEHLDHVMPLALGGKHEDSNLQLLCPPCNMSKNAKHPHDFARELGMLL
jgi:5-methylcytosine-specific restriction endonuclease McrA